MRHGSLFSGIGGFDLAAEWMGWENVFQVEKDKWCQKVLSKNFPKVKRYGDIKEFDGTKYRGSVDVLTGGFPCQPFSTAGRRKGTEDDRYLWPEMLRIIGEIQPSFIVGENVYGLINWSDGLVFEQVQTSLEDQGYKVAPVILPACAVGAPHRRERVWFVAYSNERAKRSSGKSNGINRERSNYHDEQKERGKQTKQRVGYGNVFRIDTDTDNTRLQRSENEGGFKEIRKNRDKQSSGFFQPTWQKFPTQSPLCGGNDGIPNRVDRIKGLGNAVVPQVVFEIFKAIDSL